MSSIDVELESKPALENTPAQSDVIVIKRTTFNYGVIAFVFLLVGVFIGAVLASTRSGGVDTAAVIGTSVAQAINSAGLIRATPTPGPIDVSVDNDPAWGPEDAKVVIVEFSDFECPYCSRFYQQAYQQIRTTYGDKVRFVYRDLPLPQLHPNAIAAAEAAECANEQGRFWDYHDLLFANQSRLQQGDLIDYAARLELDVDQFTECVLTRRYQAEVVKDMRDSEAYGVTGTPTFFINGYRVVGAQAFSVFQQIIEAELAKAETS